MTRCAVWVVSCFVLFLSAAGAAQAQTPGNVPVWVDPQTLGDSSLVQCGGDGSSVCIGPGSGTAVGPSSSLMGFTDSTSLNASAIYGEATAPTGATNGVVGVNQSGDNLATGVFGWAVNPAATITAGVWGRSNALNGWGVIGEGVTGVYGVSRIAPGWAVYADAMGIGGIGVYARSAGGWAGYFDGFVGFSRLEGGGTQQLCRSGSGDGGITSCSSSLRYKTDVHSFSGGLDIVTRLRPIAFNWKARGT
jgi:hypothetical protein